MITSVDKALVPVLVGAILVGLGYFGVTEEMTIGESLSLLVTSGLVWLVPNK